MFAFRTRKDQLSLRDRGLSRKEIGPSQINGAQILTFRLIGTQTSENEAELSSGKEYESLCCEEALCLEQDTAETKVTLGNIPVSEFSP